MCLLCQACQCQRAALPAPHLRSACTHRMSYGAAVHDSALCCCIWVPYLHRSCSWSCWPANRHSPALLLPLLMSPSAPPLRLQERLARSSLLPKVVGAELRKKLGLHSKCRICWPALPSLACRPGPALRWICLTCPSAWGCTQRRVCSARAADPPALVMLFRPCAAAPPSLPSHALPSALYPLQRRTVR